MARGISPRETVIIPLGDYSADYYLTLLYHSMQNMGWRISYFDHDGLIAYTNISWASYSEEVSARLIGNSIHIKSECVGYQALLYDYGKNEKNLSLLFDEVTFHETLFKDNLAATAQELMDSIPAKQFVTLDDPPMAGKELLISRLDWYQPKPKYFVTPILVLVNIGIYIITRIALAVIMTNITRAGRFSLTTPEMRERAYLVLGFSGRTQVLNGEVWRLLTNTFLHFNNVHLIGNIFVLVYIGSLIESKIGKWNFLLLYLCTGIVASMVSVSWNDTGVSGGASGAIFGLFGILLALLSTDFYERSARRALLISTVIFVAYNIIPFSRRVDHAAHFGGLIAGYIFGLLAYWSLKSGSQMRTRWAASALSVILTVGFVGASIAFTPNYQTKEFAAMKADAATVNVDLNGYFYNSVNMNHDERLKEMETMALPELKHYSAIANRMAVLQLGKNDKIDAQYRSKIIKLQCKYFNLLYLEFKDRSPKYRKAIITSTDSINTLRRQWGEARH